MDWRAPDRSRPAHGIFSLNHSEPEFYQSYHAERLAVFSAQAALALQNARLFDETIENLEREKGLNEMSQLISGTLDIPSLLPQILRLAVILVDADTGGLAAIDPDDGSISYPFLFNLPAPLVGTRFREGEGVSGQVAMTRKSVLLPEYRQHPGAHKVWSSVGVHAFIGVPILAGEVCLGVLELFNLDHKRQFDERDLRLAENIGRLAGMAIQNAQLFENSQRRIAETETLRQATTVLTSALELNQVLDQILVQLVKVVPYDSAAVFLLKGAQLRIVAARGFPGETEVIGLTFPAANLLLEQAATTGKAVILEDASLEPHFEAWVNTNYVHGWMGVPMLVRARIIGFLTIDSRKVAAYGEAESALAQAFAHHAAIAIENARLYQEALNAAERGLVLHRASQEINASLDPEQLYQAIHQATAQLMPSEAFVISRLDETAKEIEVVYLIDRSGRSPAQRTPAGRGLTGHLIATGQSIRIDDFSGDEDIDSFHFGDPEEVRSILAVPMRRADGKVFGMLSAQSYLPYAYSDDDQTLLELLAAHAATAMENARLFAEIQRLAIVDPLTGLFNRRHFFEIVQSEFERARRYSRPLSIAMLDMDHFKQVNDTYGHLVGDQVLMHLAALCRENMRVVDVIGRYGGDEFIILMPETPLKVAYQVTERLRECISKTIIEMSGKSGEITASLGVAELDKTCTSLEVLLLHADRALYTSKQIGRNQASFWKGE